MNAIKKLLVSALVIFMIVGCTAQNNNEDGDIVEEITEPVEIVFWHAMNGAQETALKKITDDFMAENENITVTLQNQSQYSDLQQKLIATSASPSDLPTLTQAYPGHVYNMAQDGLVQDLKAYIDNEAIGMSDYEDIVEEFREGAKIDGVTYGMPFNKSTEVIFYNKDVFDELNLEVPTNLAELKEVAKTIADQTDMVGAGFDSLNNFYVTYLFNEGITFNAELDPTSQVSQDALNYYLDGIKDGSFRIPGSDNYLSGPFGSETIAMSIGSTAGESYIRSGAEGKFTPAAAALPFESSIQQGTDVYMFSNGTAEQKTAAFLYMKYLVSADVQLYWAAETGYIPVRTSVLESSEYKNLDSLIAPIIDEITENLFTIPTSANSNPAYLEVSTVMEAVLSDTQSNVPAKLEELKATLTSIWSE